MRAGLLGLGVAILGVQACGGSSDPVIFREPVFVYIEAGCDTGTGGAPSSTSSTTSMASTTSASGGGAGGAEPDAGDGGDAPVFADSGPDGAPCPTWTADVWPIIDGPAGCTATGLCHGSGKGGVSLVSGMPHASYQALMAYSLAATPGPVKPYVVPGDPVASGFPCNLAVDDGDGGMSNPWGSCGSIMPLVGGLSPADVESIAAWIACGATES